MEVLNFETVVVQDVYSYIECVNKGYVNIVLENEDYKELFFRLLELEQANDNIKCAIAKCYLFGMGTLVDEQRAYSIFEPLAKNNHLDAMYYVGYCNFYGKGTKVDYNIAVFWLKRAANYNHPQAVFLFGKMHMLGQGVEPSIKEAAKYFLIATKFNMPEAYDALGCIYLNGNGVKASGIKAKEYLEVAANMNYPLGEFNLARIYHKGMDVEKNYTAAINYYRRAGDHGYPRGYYMIASMYFNHETDELTKNDGIHFMKLAAENNYPIAQYQLGKIYEQSKQYTEAAKWYMKASQGGVDDANIALGTMYLHGKGITQNCREALRWFGPLAGKNNPKALLMMGIIHSHGGVNFQKNFFRGVEWLEKAIAAGNNDAYYELGLLYATDSDNIDYEKAIYYLDKAKEANIADAFVVEARLYKSDKFYDYNPSECIYNYETAVNLGATYAEKELNNFRDYLKSYKLCQHCGGHFKGMINKVCEICGKPKDY